MGLPRTLGATTVVSGKPVPVVLAAADYTPAPIAAASFSIKNGIATIVLGSTLPTNGYNGPNGYPPSADIHGGINSQFGPGGAGQGAGPAGGQQVTLWGFTTATYFNGKKVSVIDNNPANNSFRFYFSNADVASTNDAGNTAPSPFQHYRVVRVEVSSLTASGSIFVGDLNVSSSRYLTALTADGQNIQIASENIPPEGIFIDGTNSGDKVQVSLIY